MFIRIFCKISKNSFDLKDSLSNFSSASIRSCSLAARKVSSNKLQMKSVLIFSSIGNLIFVN